MQTTGCGRARGDGLFARPEAQQFARLFQTRRHWLFVPGQGQGACRLLATLRSRLLLEVRRFNLHKSGSDLAPNCANFCAKQVIRRGESRPIGAPSNWTNWKKGKLVSVSAGLNPYCGGLLNICLHSGHYFFPAVFVQHQLSSGFTHLVAIVQDWRRDGRF